MFFIRNMCKRKVAFSWLGPCHSATGGHPLVLALPANVDLTPDGLTINPIFSFADPEIPSTTLLYHELMLNLTTTILSVCSLHSISLSGIQ